jgi:hypothetical protein
VLYHLAGTGEGRLQPCLMDCCTASDPVPISSMPISSNSAKPEADSNSKKVACDGSAGEMHQLLRRKATIQVHAGARKENQKMTWHVQ